MEKVRKAAETPLEAFMNITSYDLVRSLLYQPSQEVPGLSNSWEPVWRVTMTCSKDLRRWMLLTRAFISAFQAIHVAPNYSCRNQELVCVQD